jgi:hypothetical protein
MPNYRRAFVPGGCWFFIANSSLHRDVCAAIVTEDWAGEIETPGEFGERALFISGAIRFAIASYAVPALAKNSMIRAGAVSSVWPATGTSQ